MMILRLGEMHEREMIRAAVRVLKQGGVIAFPTETTYGLGCDPRNANAVKKIFQMKGRVETKPLLLVAANVAQVNAVGAIHELPVRFREIAKRYWPGPLTIVLPARRDAGLARGVVPKGEVAVRVSSSLFVQRLTTAFGFSIVATSANRSGEPDCRSGRAVAKAFHPLSSPFVRGRSFDQPDLILDIGALPRRKPSTVARIAKDGNVEILRQGSVRIR